MVMMFRLSAIALLVFLASTFGPSQVGNAVRVTPIEKELSLRFFSLGSLSKNDGDGYERVIYKLNLRCSNGRCLVSTSFKKREPQDVPRRSRAVMAKKCTKRRGARAKFFFANLSLSMRFCCSRCCRRHRYLAPFYCLHFIFARIHVRITRQWKHLKGNVRLAYE